MKAPGRLFIVATPIGNYQDITLRALETLRNADVVVCEEYREGSTLLKRLEIPGKELMTLNEHNEQEQLTLVLGRLAAGQNLALISDCGTPVFADPGAALVEMVSQAGFQVVPVPGPSSLMAALSVLDFKPERFYYAGFLPREPEKRRAELTRLRGMQTTIVILDTPYRLGVTLDEVGAAFGKGRRVTLACDITQPTETIHRGPVGEIRQKVKERKAEFVLIVHPSPEKAR